MTVAVRNAYVQDAMEAARTHSSEPYVPGRCDLTQVTNQNNAVNSLAACYWRHNKAAKALAVQELKKVGGKHKTMAELADEKNVRLTIMQDKMQAKLTPLSGRDSELAAEMRADPSNERRMTIAMERDAPEEPWTKFAATMVIEFGLCKGTSTTPKPRGCKARRKRKRDDWKTIALAVNDAAAS